MDFDEIDAGLGGHSYHLQKIDNIQKMLTMERDKWKELGRK